MPNITQGSKEFFIVSVIDVLGTLTDLSSATPVTFDVYAYQATPAAPGSALMSSVAATLDITGGQQMDAYCLVDTSTGSGLTTPDVPVTGYWALGDYHLFIKFVTGLETPRKGPHLFTVVSGR